MSVIHQRQTRHNLVCVSAARFDQQLSTRPHLDGGPEECFLMLGYEPSEVVSELEIYDYSKCAYDLGMKPEEFLSSYNPMFREGQEKLSPYSTPIPNLSSDYRLICINNSCCSRSDTCPTWQGVLHNATVSQPDETKRRVINSMVIASVPRGSQEGLSESELQQFAATTQVRRRGYDKVHLDDDL